MFRDELQVNWATNRFQYHAWKEDAPSFFFLSAILYTLGFDIRVYADM